MSPNKLWLLRRGEHVFAAFLTTSEQFGRPSGMQFQVAVRNGETGTRITQDLFKRLEDGVARAGSYRGKVLSLDKTDQFTGKARGILVHKLKKTGRDQVILPQKTLELLERNVLHFARQREKLNSLGFSTRKGLLFYGLPGTGKTHTLHYLAGAMPQHTILLITAGQVAQLGEYMVLARLLQPSIVVIEDADLIGRDRETMEGPCEEVLLNKLLNEMDGLQEDAEILFILTTNRPEALEAALASRPGRIDQAIEFPLPDEACRDRLVRLYAGKIEVSDEVITRIVSKTDRVSAAFIKELMRKAAQFHFERDDSPRIIDEDIDRALDELLIDGGSLNQKLLGAHMRQDAQ